MIAGIPRISVLVICYNQEKVISRAIDSLLAQKDYIYEICVSDDNSKDRTWEILQEYDRQYPGLFVLNRNEPNVGIFENFEKTWTMPSGDLVYQLSGDDECGENWMQTIIGFIQRNHIDYKNEDVCFYGDYKAIYPNGDLMVFRNNLINTTTDTIYLFLRNCIGMRSVCFSIGCLKRFEKVSQGRSHIAETAQEVQIPLNAQKNYYIAHVGNIYYTGIGISTQTSSDRFFDERQMIVPYALSFLERKGVSVDPEFTPYIKANLAAKEFHHNRSLKNLLKMVFCKIRSYDHRIGLKSIGFKQLVFALRRRLPHKRPIVMYI